MKNLDGVPGGYQCVELVASPSVMHMRLARAAGESERVTLTQWSADSA
jgi:hypothetical protein